MKNPLAEKIEELEEQVEDAELSDKKLDGILDDIKFFCDVCPFHNSCSEAMDCYLAKWHHEAEDKPCVPFNEGR